MNISILILPCLRKIAIILILLPLSLFAQDDYAVTYKGDTLRGEVILLSYDQLDKVQVATKEKKVVLTALQIKSAFKDNYFYQAVRYDNSIRMMKILKSGYLSYYAFNSSTQLTWDGRYLSKKDGSGLEVPNLSFKKILAKFLSDCPEIKERIEQGDYSKRDVEKIVDAYNDCLQAKTNALGLSSTQTHAENSEVDKEIKNLISKVEAENFVTKKDALDILKDMESKVSKNEKVPNYLIEGLKSSLLDTPSLSKEFDKLIPLLKK